MNYEIGEGVRKDRFTRRRGDAEGKTKNGII